MAIKYEKWGNNEFHDPTMCEEDCPYNCATCSNGPRGVEYKRAVAEARLRDMEAVRFAQEMGYLG